jgi:hypothetical protein
LYCLILENCDASQYYKCSSGECIPLHEVCDGTVSCFNGTDESGMCGEYKIISGVLEKFFSLLMVLSLNISNGFT